MAGGIVVRGGEVSQTVGCSWLPWKVLQIGITAAHERGPRRARTDDLRIKSPL